MDRTRLVDMRLGNSKRTSKISITSRHFKFCVRAPKKYSFLAKNSPSSPPLISSYPRVPRPQCPTTSSASDKFVVDVNLSGCVPFDIRSFCKQHILTAHSHLDPQHPNKTWAFIFLCTEQWFK